MSQVGNQTHLDTLWEESSSIFLFHSRHLDWSEYCNAPLKGHQTEPVIHKLLTTMQLPPAFQSTGVATYWILRFLCLIKIKTLRVAVSWRLSITRRISSKFLPFEKNVTREQKICLCLLSRPSVKQSLWCPIMPKTCCGWVEQRQLQPLVRANDEDCPVGGIGSYLKYLLKFNCYDLQVRGMPLASFSSGSIIPYRVATSLLGSAMIG